MIIIIKAKNIKRCAVIHPPEYGGIYILWLLLVFLLGYFLKSPTLAAESVRSALHVCAVGLIPSLFPFIVLVNMMRISGMAEWISSTLGRPISWLFGIDEQCSYAVILGSLGGFPIGAICTNELYMSGVIDKSSAERLLTFTNNASPAFCIGAIGISLFSDAALGIKLYFCQLISAVIIGIVQRRNCKSTQHTKKRTVSSTHLSDILTHSVTAGGETVFKICAFAIFFAVVGDALCIVSNRFFGDTVSAISAVLCELTLAARKCSELGGKAGYLMCAFAVGWSGISVHMQTASVLSKSGISMRRYLICKFFQGVLCCIMMFVLI